MRLWRTQDTDGAAYLVRSVENKYAGISQLTPDYLNTTGIISKGPRVEGQCIFKFQGAYYLLGSHLTGTFFMPAPCPPPCCAHTQRCITHTYTHAAAAAATAVCPSTHQHRVGAQSGCAVSRHAAHTAWHRLGCPWQPQWEPNNLQLAVYLCATVSCLLRRLAMLVCTPHVCLSPTFVSPSARYTHPNGKELLIYMGDRWNDHGPGGLVNATYIWQPFVVENDSLMLQGTLNFTWHDKWAIKDFST